MRSWAVISGALFVWTAVADAPKRDDAANRPRIDAATVSGGELLVKMDDSKSFPIAKTMYGLFAESCVNGTGVAEFQSCFSTDPTRVRNPKLAKTVNGLLADLKPRVLRFPGGCFVEGTDPARVYDWRKAVGPYEQRTAQKIHWNTDDSGELGFYEYFCLAERLGAEPLPTLPAGLTCQLQSKGYFVTGMKQMDWFVGLALDLVEFANGGVTSKWGRVRAEMGHPAPFNLRYLGVGNENFGTAYVERYKLIAEKVRERYPSMRFIASVFGSEENRELIRRAVAESGNVDLCDEHAYMDEWGACTRARKYDGRKRDKAAKIFMGEWSTKLDRDPKDCASAPENFRAALLDAVAMCGWERNGDLVVMNAYAPLFAAADRRNWTPNLITYQGDIAWGSPGYYAFRMFSTTCPDFHVPSENVGKGSVKHHFACCGRNRDGSWVLRLVNRTDEPCTMTFRFPRTLAAGSCRAESMSAENDAENDRLSPTRVTPHMTEVPFPGGDSWIRTLPPRTVEVVRIVPQTGTSPS